MHPATRASARSGPARPRAFLERQRSPACPPSLRSGFRSVPVRPPPSGGLPEDPYRPVNATLDTGPRQWKIAGFLILGEPPSAMPTAALPSPAPPPPQPCSNRRPRFRSGENARTNSSARTDEPRALPRKRALRIAESAPCTTSAQFRHERTRDGEPGEMNLECPPSSKMHERIPRSARSNPRQGGQPESWRPWSASGQPKSGAAGRVPASRAGCRAPACRHARN